MRAPLGILAFSLLALPASAAEVNVRVMDGRVDLSATAAPIAEVLDRLSKQTGMKVVYEGPAPRQLVTLSLHGRSPAEAVLGLLEGQGLNFILLGDASGDRVQTLMMAGAAPGASSRAASSAPPAASKLFPPPASGPEADNHVEELIDEEEPEPAPDALPPSGLPPGVPGAPLLPTVPGGAAPSPAQPTPPALFIPGVSGGTPPAFPAAPFTSTPFGPQLPGGVQPGPPPAGGPDAGQEKPSP